jgi:hypothetical protein
MLLHVMPQRLSFMQVWQISKPQAQLQQKRNSPRQQQQWNRFLRSRFFRAFRLGSSAAMDPGPPNNLQETDRIIIIDDARRLNAWPQLLALSK